VHFKKSAIMRIALFQGFILLRYFALHKSSKNHGTRFFKCCFFKNLGSLRLFEGFFDYFSLNIHTSWHGKIDCSKWLSYTALKRLLAAVDLVSQVVMSNSWIGNLFSYLATRGPPPPTPRMCLRAIGLSTGQGYLESDFIFLPSSLTRVATVNCTILEITFFEDWASLTELPRNELRSEINSFFVFNCVSLTPYLTLTRPEGESGCWFESWSHR
jgi:hypothetical protein